MSVPAGSVVLTLVTLPTASYVRALLNSVAAGLTRLRLHFGIYPTLAIHASLRKPRSTEGVRHYGLYVNPEISSVSIWI